MGRENVPRDGLRVVRLERLDWRQPCPVGISVLPREGQSIRLLATERPERLLDVRALFEMADVDASGSIGLEEVTVIIEELGYRPTAAGLRALFGRMDVDGSGQVSYVEFCTAVLAAPPMPGSMPADAGAVVDLTREVHGAAGVAAASHVPANNILPVALGGRIFDFFDTDGSGSIDERKMLAKLKGLGFDSRGVSHLFEDLVGAERDVISRSDFLRYIEEVNAKVAAKADA